MARPDIAHIIPSFVGGGAEKVCFQLAEAMAERGLRTDLVALRGHGQLRDMPLKAARKVDLRAIDEFLALPNYVRYLQRTRPRLVFAHVYTSTFAAALAQPFFANIPVIGVVHIKLQRPPEEQWWFRRYFGLRPERSLYRRFAHFSAVSEGLASEVQDVFQAPSGKVSAIPNPIAAPKSKAEIAPQHEAIFERPVILNVGRLVPQKDHIGLISAFAEIKTDEQPNLLILGEGPERNALLAHAAALNVSDRVFLPGFVDNPRSYMQRCTVFALSSVSEGFSLVIAEAMSEGAAIVSTDCDFGPREILDGGTFGTLVPTGDPNALADALGKTLTIPPAINMAARAARLERFSPQTVVDQYIALAERFLPSSSPQP